MMVHDWELSCVYINEQQHDARLAEDSVSDSALSLRESSRNSYGAIELHHSEQEQEGRWKVRGAMALWTGVGVCMPGLLVALGLLPAPTGHGVSLLARFIVLLFDYSWFVALALASATYFLLTRYLRALTHGAQSELMVGGG